MKVYKVFTFSAAHHLTIPGHPCSQMHGHNYTLKIECAGPLNIDGMVIDFDAIRRIVRPVVAKLDHAFLNDILPITTAEGVCQWVQEQIHGQLPLLSAIEVWETATCGARLEIA